MPDWFVDRLATGTGTGATPTNAATNIASLCAVTPAGVLPGDFIWIRRTHFEVASNQSLLWGSNSGNVTAQSASLPCHLVGWPNSADPWFDLRPTSARSGQTPDWDNDSINKPYFHVDSIANSAVGAFNPRPNSHVWNMTFVSSSGGKPPLAIDEVTQQNFNCDFFFPSDSAPFNSDTFNFDNITMTTSRAVADGYMFDNLPAQIGKLTIGSGTCFNGGVFWSGVPIDAMHVHVDTSSLKALFSDGGFLGSTFTTQRRVRRVSGNKPFYEDMITTLPDLNANIYRVYIDDYYGEGARILAPPSGIGMATVTSAQANFVGRRVGRLQVNSCATANHISGQGGLWHPWPEFSGFVRVSSGTPIGVRWNVYMVAMGNPELIPFKIHFLADVRSYATPVVPCVGSRYLGVGNVNSWSGTLVSAGSAYTLVHTVTPRETATIMVNLFAPRAVTRSGYILVCQELEAFS